MIAAADGFAEVGERLHSGNRRTAADRSRRASPRHRRSRPRRSRRRSRRGRNRSRPASPARSAGGSRASTVIASPTRMSVGPAADRDANRARASRSGASLECRGRRRGPARRRALRLPSRPTHPSPSTVISRGEHGCRDDLGRAASSRDTGDHHRERAWRRGTPRRGGAATRPSAASAKRSPRRARAAKVRRGKSEIDEDADAEEDREPEEAAAGLHLALEESQPSRSRKRIEPVAAAKAAGPASAAACPSGCSVNSRGLDARDRRRSSAAGSPCPAVMLHQCVCAREPLNRCLRARLPGVAVAKADDAVEDRTARRRIRCRG